jgi:vacuolar-type H+-ATPase subunit C/Vma6
MVFKVNVLMVRLPNYRYACKLGNGGLYPADAEQALLVDEVVNICQDMLSNCSQASDKDVKKAAREAYADGDLISIFTTLTNRLLYRLTPPKYYNPLSPLLHLIHHTTP